MYTGINGCQFEEVANSLKFKDPYMVLADFDSYVNAQNRVDSLYKDKYRFGHMCLMNTANAGFFSSDRSVKEYADRIWHLTPIDETK